MRLSIGSSFSLGVLLTLIVLAAGGLIAAFGGLYNVAATDPHSGIGHWAFETTMRNSVQMRAAALAPPSTARTDIVAGAGEYKAMCQHCHGGPGTGRAEWASGMNPLPPDLAKAAHAWTAAEIFWMIKHGVKMTGMPAFGPTHSDATLWNIAAFVEQLPTMQADQYRAIGSAHGHGGTGSDETAANKATAGSVEHDHSGHTH